MAIAYKTRAQANPQGKPRVLLACAPEDLDSCLEGLVKKILQEQDCAVFFDDATDNRGSGLVEAIGDLSSFQLVVVPVTTSLFRSGSLVLDELVPRALDLHVPLLPVMLETELRDAYMCTPLSTAQYLDLASTDPTAISSDHKLRSFLRSCLASDELAQRVRKAFDAYIFLSYRKKDRAYAQQLMRAIHKSPLCRDIAIWYDEYLVLGEDFNESIAEALSKCSVFALVVTPNLLEQGNYVMREEYPAAVRAQMPVEPVKMQAVDLRELAAAFEGVGEVCDAANPYELTALCKRLRNAVGEGRVRDEEHEFLIGAAYLYGIDVETDADRALELIQKGAQADYVESLRLLGNMYAAGNGVTQNAGEAARYRERVIDKLKAACQREGTPESFHKLVKESFDLWSTYYALCDPEREVKLYCGLLEVMVRMPRVYGSDVVNVYSKLGLSECEARRFKPACEHLRKAQEYGARLPFAERTQWQIEILESLATAEYYLGNLDSALECRMQLVEMARDNEARTHDEGDKTRLGVCLGKLAESYSSISRYDKAVASLRESSALFGALVGEFGVAKYGRNLVTQLCKLGNYSNLAGNVSYAVEVLDDAVNIAKLVVRETGTLGAHRNLSLASDYLGQALVESDSQRALSCVLLAVAERRWLIEHSSYPSDLLYLGHYLNHAAVACKKLRRYEDAIALARESEEDLRKYYGQTEQVDTLTSLAATLLMLIELSVKAGDCAGAVRFDSDAVMVYEYLSSTQLYSEHEHLGHCECRMCLCEAELELQNIRQAHAHIAAAVQLAEGLTKTNPHLPYRISGLHARVYDAEGDETNAYRFYQATLNKAFESANESGVLGEDQASHFIEYAAHFAEFARRHGHPDVALPVLDQSLALAWQLLEVDGAEERWYAYARAYALAVSLCSNKRQARAYAQRGLEACKAYQRAYPSSPVRANLEIRLRQAYESLPE